MAEAARRQCGADRRRPASPTWCTRDDRAACPGRPPDAAPPPPWTSTSSPTRAALPELARRVGRRCCARRRSGPGSSRSPGSRRAGAPAPSDASSLFVLRFRQGRETVGLMPTELGPHGELRFVGGTGDQLLRAALPAGAARRRDARAARLPGRRRPAVGSPTGAASGRARRRPPRSAHSTFPAGRRRAPSGSPTVRASTSAATGPSCTDGGGAPSARACRASGRRSGGSARSSSPR